MSRIGKSVRESLIVLVKDGSVDGGQPGDIERVPGFFLI